MKRWSAIVVSLACACAPPAPLTPRVSGGIDDAPLVGADTLVVSVVADGRVVDGASTRVTLPATRFDLTNVPFGRSLALRVEAFAGSVPLARGRSFPFDYAGAEDRPVVPDVLLATLGRITRTVETTESVVALVATPDGAVMTTREGRIFSYVAHGGPGGAAVLVATLSLPARRDASWTQLRGEDGALALLGVGGLDDGASLVDAQGALVMELVGSDVGPSRGIALATSSGGEWAIAAGGSDTTGSPTSELTRYEVSGARLVRTPLTPLASPRSHGSAIVVGVELGGHPGEVVLVVGGTTNELVDPTTGARLSTIVDPMLEGRAWVAVETGLVVAAGGIDAAGTISDAVDLYLVRPEHDPWLSRVSPAPSALFAPRADAIATRLGPGLALIASGRGPGASAVRGSELVEVRLDSLPGEVVPTGSLPVDVRANAMTRLLDRSVLLVGERLVAAYVPPRGPE